LEEEVEPLTSTAGCAVAQQNSIIDIFKARAMVEAPVTRLELMATGMLGVCCDGSNEVDSDSFVT